MKNVKTILTATVVASALLGGSAMASTVIVDLDMKNSAGKALYTTKADRCTFTVGTDGEQPFSPAFDKAKNGKLTVHSSSDAGSQDHNNVKVHCNTLWSEDPSIGTKPLHTAGFDLQIGFDNTTHAVTSYQFKPYGNYSTYNPKCMPKIDDIGSSFYPHYKITCSLT